MYYDKIIKDTYFFLKTIQAETTTTVSIPQYYAGSITIEGDDVSKVIEARHKLHFIANEIRNSHGVVQFISIPTLSEEIKEKFLRFKVLVCVLKEAVLIL